MSDSRKINITLSIDSNIKRDFKSENAINGSDMSATVENFMENYVKASRQLRSLKEKEDGR